MSDPSPLAHLGPPSPPLLGPQHPYSVQGLRIQTGNVGTWKASLTRDSKQVAHMISRASVIDVEFNDPLEEVAFLQAIQDRTFPSGVPVTVENAALDLVLTQIGEQSPELILTRTADGTPNVFPRPEGEITEDVLALIAVQDAREVYQPGQGWCELYSTGTLLSAAPPLPLLHACRQAMHLHKVHSGDTLDFSITNVQAMYELGGIARALLDLPEEPDNQGGALSLRFVLVLLAGLGTTLPASDSAAQEVLDACMARTYPGTTSTLAHLSLPPEDTCEHEHLLRAMVTVQPLIEMPGWADEAELGEVQEDLLMAAVSVIRALHSVLHVDVNATLTDMLAW